MHFWMKYSKLIELDLVSAKSKYVFHEKHHTASAEDFQKQKGFYLKLLNQEKFCYPREKLVSKVYILYSKYVLNI